LVDSTGKTVKSTKSTKQTTTGVNSTGQAVGNAESVGTINPAGTTGDVTGPREIGGGTVGGTGGSKVGGPIKSRY
jgi:hypothetical protein